MTRVLLVAIAAFTLAMPASAAEVDPSALVLRLSDLPAGFAVKRGDTGLRTNEQEAKKDPRGTALFERWGRVTGYQAAFDRGSATIDSRADLLRTPKGARMLFDFFVVQVRKSGVKGVVQSRVRLGAEGWVYHGRAPVAFTAVAWRYKRVFAGVAAVGISRERTLALARVQQRRVAAALS